MEQFLIDIFVSMKDLTFIPEAAALVVAVVQILKWIPAVSLNPRIAAFWVQAAVWVIVSGVRLAGYEFDDALFTSLDNTLRGIIAFIDAIAPVLVGFGASTALAHFGYEWLHTKDIPGFRNG